VDEIDLHLHPKWQRDLIGFLSERFINTQFVVTAHSPLVVQAAQNANVALLRREGDHVVIDNDVERIRGWRVDQVLTSDLFGLESARPPELDELLAKRKELLSKGRLTKKDRTALKDVENKIGPLPAGETPEQIRSIDTINRAAKLIQQKG
jgi:predicted ATP-binding protein involved in virulence